LAANVSARANARSSSASRKHWRLRRRERWSGSRHMPMRFLTTSRH
jgi:hypothetical protein